MAISRKAFEDQVLELFGTLHGVARRVTCNGADADDLVAETVARAWRAREALEDEAAFRAWIFRILHNTFISDKRRVAARGEVPLEWTEDEESDAARFSNFEQR